MYTYPTQHLCSLLSASTPLSSSISSPRTTHQDHPTAHTLTPKPRLNHSSSHKDLNLRVKNGMEHSNAKTARTYAHGARRLTGTIKNERGCIYAHSRMGGGTRRSIVAAALARGLRAGVHAHGKAKGRERRGYAAEEQVARGPLVPWPHDRRALLLLLFGQWHRQRRQPREQSR